MLMSLQLYWAIGILILNTLEETVDKTRITINIAYTYTSVHRGKD